MSFFEWLQELPARIGLKKDRQALPEGPGDDMSQDAFAATRELSRLLVEDNASASVANPIDTADISIILGNLFRAQGDIARAVRLREALLARADMNASLKARIFFELGCDYRRSGLLDRALDSYKEARKLGFSGQAVSGELAHLFADSGDFAAAAREFSAIGNARGEAYFLVMQAEEQAAQGDDGAAVKLLKRAAGVYPGSPEAWLALTCMNLMSGDAAGARKRYTAGLAKAKDSAGLILLEGLHAFINGPSAPAIPPGALHALLIGLNSDFAAGDADLMLCYYGGLFMRRIEQADEAEQWFTKALVIEPDFWAARLALLALTADRESLPPLLGQQIVFFTRKAAESKRFFCRSCGMRRKSIFSCCPRCRAWHSVAFRLYLN